MAHCASCWYPFSSPSWKTKCVGAERPLPCAGLIRSANVCQSSMEKFCHSVHYFESQGHGMVANRNWTTVCFLKLQNQALISFCFPTLISAPIGQAVHRLLLIQAFRPDRLLAMAHHFVSTNLGDNFMSIMEQPLDLSHIVDTEASTCISSSLLCSRALLGRRCLRPF